MQRPKRSPAAQGREQGAPRQPPPRLPRACELPHLILPLREDQLRVTERGHVTPQGQIRGSAKKAGLGRKSHLSLQGREERRAQGSWYSARLPFSQLSPHLLPSSVPISRRSGLRRRNVPSMESLTQDLRAWMTPPRARERARHCSPLPSGPRHWPFVEASRGQTARRDSHS